MEKGKTKKKAKKSRDVIKKDEDEKTKESHGCLDGSDCRPDEKPPGFCDGCGG